MITLLGDFGVSDAKVRVGMDASAAIGMAQRNGLNKVRHVEVDVLWLQEQAVRKMRPITKIPGPWQVQDGHMVFTEDADFVILEAGAGVDSCC